MRDVSCSARRFAAESTIGDQKSAGLWGLKSFSLTSLPPRIPVTVAGSQLAPGQYKLTWEGTGPDVTVKFAEGKNVVATAPAKLVNTSTNQEAIETDTVADSTRLLRAVDLKRSTIQFENAAPGAGN